MSARVYLGNSLVGRLEPHPARLSTSFEFDPSYADNPLRPILGRWFEDLDITPPRRFEDSPLPNFFRNLLPEGALRKIVEKRLGSTALPEYTMLLRLGEQLPGAVRVVGDGEDPDDLEENERLKREPGDPYRFALTGVQPKLSLSNDGDRLTVPIENQDGFWIAKFGTYNYQKLVENEFTMLRWAKQCGLNVPEHRLIDARDIQGLPPEFEPDQRVLVVQRFDRTADGKRIHQEDFAQVFGIRPDDKYVNELADLGRINFGSIGAIIYALCGFDDYLEYVKRLVFMVLSGNCDAHVKNWALIYPDGLNTRLAPVYDFVSTAVYPGYSRSPALRWMEPNEPSCAPEKALEQTALDDLLVAVSHTEADTAVVMEEIASFDDLARRTWAEVAGDAPLFIRNAVDGHLAGLCLR